MSSFHSLHPPVSDSDIGKCPFYSLALKSFSWCSSLFPTSFKASQAPISPAESFLNTCDEMSISQNVLKGPLTSKFGCLPSRHPEMSLPESLALFNQKLPEFWGDGCLVERLSEVPSISLSEIPQEKYPTLACVLGNVIQSHHHSQRNSETRVNVPSWVMELWESLCVKLERKQLLRVYDSERKEYKEEMELVPFAFINYNDIIHNNWKLSGCKSGDTYEPSQILVENQKLDLLTKTIGDQAERNFYLAQLEMSAESIDLITHAAQAQTAVLNSNESSLRSHLTAIISIIRKVSKSFQKILPNVYSSTSVEPIQWARGIGLLGKPFRERILWDDREFGPVQGLNGFGSLITHLIDVFLGRKKYECPFAKQAIFVRLSFPELWQNYLKNLAEVNVRDFVKKATPLVQALFIEVEEVYSDFLEAHIIKLYTYLEITLKSSASLNGFLAEKKWKYDGKELALTNSERMESVDFKREKVSIKRIDHFTKNTAVIEFDFLMPYQIGDHVGIIAPNPDEVISRTLEVMGCDGSEMIAFLGCKDRVSSQNQLKWVKFLEFLGKKVNEKEVALKTMIKYGKIQRLNTKQKELLVSFMPKNPKENQDFSKNSILQNNGSLTDILKIFAESIGSSTKNILIYPSNQERNEGYFGLWDLIDPQDFRYYSISSHPNENCLKILVTSVEQEYPSGVHYKGLASNYLVHSLKPRQGVHLKLVSNKHFSLPKNPNLPIVMIAAGNGISMFRSIILDRIREENKQNWLFLSAKNKEDFFYEQELSEFAAKGYLSSAICLTRQDKSSEESKQVHQTFHYKKRINTLLLENQQLLLSLITEQKASIYVCGSSGFTSTVIESLKQIVSDSNTINKLMIDERLCVEGFSHNEPKKDHIFLSDMIRDSRPLTIINDCVYDLSDFAQKHVGGADVLDLYRGCDATEAFNFVKHDKSPQVMSQMSFLMVAKLFNPSLFPCIEVIYNDWKKILLKAVETRNCWKLEMKYFEAETNAIGKLKKSDLIKTHKKIWEVYLPAIYDEKLMNLRNSLSDLVHEAETHRNETFFNQNLKRIQSSDDNVGKLIFEQNVFSEFLETFIGKLCERLITFEKTFIHSRKCLEPCLETLMKLEKCLGWLEKKIQTIWND